jgi:hypothetical protein
MAGVGRRGFAAAVAATMFAVSHAQSHGHSQPHYPDQNKPNLFVSFKGEFYHLSHW